MLSFNENYQHTYDQVLSWMNANPHGAWTLSYLVEKVYGGNENASADERIQQESVLAKHVVRLLEEGIVRSRLLDDDDGTVIFVLSAGHLETIGWPDNPRP